MSFDLTWPKVAALTTIQAAAQTAIGALTSSASSGPINWAHIGETSGISALVAFLAMVIAYRLPSQPATAAVSAPTALHQYADEDRKPK